MTEAWKKLRNSFFAGLLVVVPIAASVLILVGLFTWVTDFMLPEALRKQMFTPLYRIIALIVFVAFTTAVGWVTRLVAGKRMVVAGEAIITRVPLLNKIYSFLKEISQTLLGGRKTVFERVVLVPHPRQGMYALGLVTNQAAAEARAKTKSDLLHVFVPASPPAHGFLLMVPRDQVIDLEMSVADGMKLVLSGGTIAPPYPAKTELPAPSAPD